MYIRYIVVLFVVLFQEMPTYNEKRRMTLVPSTYGSLQRSRSNPSLHMLNLHDSTANTSPVPSIRSAYPTFNGGSSAPGAWNGYDSDSPRSMSICSSSSLAGACLTSLLLPVRVFSGSCGTLLSCYPPACPVECWLYTFIAFVVCACFVSFVMFRFVFM